MVWKPLLNWRVLKLWVKVQQRLTLTSGRLGYYKFESSNKYVSWIVLNVCVCEELLRWGVLDAGWICNCVLPATLNSTKFGQNRAQKKRGEEKQEEEEEEEKKKELARRIQTAEISASNSSSSSSSSSSTTTLRRGRSRTRRPRLPASPLIPT